MEEPPKLPLKARIKSRPAPAAVPPETPADRQPDVPAFRELVEAILKKKVQETTAANLTGAVLLCAAGLVTMFFTWWFIYFFLSLGTGWLIKLPFGLKAALAWGAVIGLFFLNARTQADELMELQVDTPDGGEPIHFYIPHVGMVTNIEVFGPNTLRSGIKLVSAIVLICPQLFSSALAAFKRAARLKETDIAGCATIIAMLLGKAKKVTFMEILAAAPQLDLCGIVPQLGNLDGVVFLQEEPKGITLTADLRHDFLAGCGIDMPTM